MAFAVHTATYLMLKLQKTHIFIIDCPAACSLPKISRLLQTIAFYDSVYFRFRRFPPIFFVRHENGGSRQNHEFTTCVHELTASLGENRFRDHGEHEFTIPMERSNSQTTR